MPVVFVHGLPETSRVWDPLRSMLAEETHAVALPGFGVPRPPGFDATKEAYARWLAGAVGGFGTPVDLVGHDLGALLVMRVVTGYDVPVRSWAVDVANIFHPEFEWPERTRQLQAPGEGEEILRARRELPRDDPGSTESRLRAVGVPDELARDMAAAHDDEMSASILAFYRSAEPNVARDWWPQTDGAARGEGLVLLLPDPPEDEAMSLEVAHRLGANTARLDGLDHCWMAQDPARVAAVLKDFWSEVGRTAG